MRKTAAFIIISAMLASIAAEPSFHIEDYRGFPIVAQKGAVQNVEVKELRASSPTEPTGMPFYLTDESVAYGGTPEAAQGKRRIADWSFYTNTPDPRIRITASPLRHSSGAAVPYYLSFYFQYSDNGAMRDGSIIVESGTDYYSENDMTSGFNDATGAINFTERPVRFMLGDIDISSPSYPYGRYTATVTITILGE